METRAFMREHDKCEHDENDGASSDIVGMDVCSLIESFGFHLNCTLAKDQYTATDQDKYYALALAVRDRLIDRWLKTQQTYHTKNVKRVAYLSLEFMIGRMMSNNVINLMLEEPVRQAMEQLDLDWRIIKNSEVDAALGNGGLGRLAACFLDSIATLKLPGIGYGIRYDYGVFKQQFENGWQVEAPDNWLRYGNPWEVCHPEVSFKVHFGGRVDETVGENGKVKYEWVDTRPIIGIAYDTPIVGYDTDNVNCLRLWAAKATDEFHLKDFSRGSYVEAVEDKMKAENLTKVLYPDDSIYEGRELRLRQQYFFVSCSVQDILRRFKQDNKDNWETLPDKVFIQMNDTHPSLAIPELMRLLIDDEGLEFKRAWNLTVKTCGYTNHTLLPEALETWPTSMFARLLPRHLQLIYQINDQFIDEIKERYPNDIARIQRMSIVQEFPEKSVRMAHMAIVGSSSTNGVAELHTKLLREGMMKDFEDFYPGKFNNKTNGVTPRRWILKSNPALSTTLKEKIGMDWVKDLKKIQEIEKYSEDKKFIKRIQEIKRLNKENLIENVPGFKEIGISSDSIFQVQAKRMHEYKRQLLQAMYIIWLYDKIKKNPKKKITPQTFIFSGKAAPAYIFAKLVIKLINSISEVIHNDPDVRDKIKVIFVPDYGVTIAEKLVPAADVSVQISTAGHEASGTGNMKFSMNGALTVGTLDGANIEIMEEVGKENIFIFGLTAEEVQELRPKYNPEQMYETNKDVKIILDLIRDETFSKNEPGIFRPILDNLLAHGDYFMNIADLSSYIKTQEDMEKLYRNQDEWTKMAILNIARMGKFSSDRTIDQYAKEIWNISPIEVSAGG